MFVEINPEADDHHVILTLEQYSRKLGTIDEQVVRPFDGDPAFAHIGFSNLLQGNSCDESQGCRRGIPDAEPDDRAGLKICGR